MVVSLFVSVGVGLAPVLGTVGVPLFTPLLTLIPLQIRSEAITLSTAAMGLIAITIQWSSHRAPGKRILEKRFRVVLATTLVTFIILFLVSNFLVVPVHYLTGQKKVSFLKGFSRPIPDPCAGLSDEACIQQKLTFNIADVDGYWGDGQIALSRCAFLLAYVGLLAQFGVLIGYLVLLETRVIEDRRASHAPRARGRKGKGKAS
jgi:hypothetical protein